MGIVPGVSSQEQSNIVRFRFMFATVGQDKAIVGQGATGELRDLWIDALGGGPEGRRNDRALGHYALAHALASMPSQRMRHFMAENGGQAGFILGHGKNPRIDRNLPPPVVRTHFEFCHL